MSLANTIFHLINRKYAIRQGVHVGRRLHVGPGSRVWAPTRLTIGDDVYIGKRCTIEVDGSIGSQVLIANNVGIVGRRDHDSREVGVAIRSATWCGTQEGRHLRSIVSVGDDVWIGYGAIILGPVTIGRGAIVAAGAVVVHDVDPYSVVGGSPAKPIASRFTPAEEHQHEQILYAKTRRASENSLRN